MNIRIAAILSFFIASAYSCRGLTVPDFSTPAPTSGADPSLLHYEDQWLALDYPRGWNIHLPDDASFKWHPPVALEGDLVVGIGDSQYRFNKTYIRFFRILRRLQCACDNVQTVMDESYQSLNLRYPLAESVYKSPEAIVVSGISSPQKSYRIFWGEPAYDLRDIWVRSGENLYIISISTRWSNPEDLAAFEAVADAIVRSIVIK